MPNVDRPTFEALVERVQRRDRARRSTYQANVARRLVAPVRRGPVARSTVASGPATRSPTPRTSTSGSGGRSCRRARSRSSPSTPTGTWPADPIKGTRPRGATPRAADRALACELLASRQGPRAENVMIVDVLRNDLGRVCVPGTVRVPRLVPRWSAPGACSTSSRPSPAGWRPGADAFDLLAAAFPGGSITGRTEGPGDGDHRVARARPAWPVHRRRRCGSGADGAMGSSILIRTFVADGAPADLHVGGGMTWRSRPGRGVRGDRGQGARPALAPSALSRSWRVPRAPGRPSRSGRRTDAGRTAPRLGRRAHPAC